MFNWEGRVLRCMRRMLILFQKVFESWYHFYLNAIFHNGFLFIIGDNITSRKLEPLPGSQEPFIARLRTSFFYLKKIQVYR